MKTSPNITSAGNYFVHIAGCYRVKFQVENATDVKVAGVFGKYHYPSAEVDLDDYASIEYVDSKLGVATEEEFREMLEEVLNTPSTSAVFKDGNLTINNFSYDDGTKNFNIE